MPLAGGGPNPPPLLPLHQGLGPGQVLVRNQMPQVGAGGSGGVGAGVGGAGALGGLRGAIGGLGGSVDGMGRLNLGKNKLI